MTMTTEYQQAHRAVARLHGKASEHPCVQCESPAYDWAYQHTDPAAQIDANGLMYSTDPIHYAAMCKPCHKRLDVEHETPAQREARSEHMRWVQSQRKGYHSVAHAEAAAKNAVKARSKIDRTDPVFLDKMRKAGEKAASARRKCAECGMESTRAGIGTHQKYSGHVGYTDTERYGK